MGQNWWWVVAAVVVVALLAVVVVLRGRSRRADAVPPSDVEIAAAAAGGAVGAVGAAGVVTASRADGRAANRVDGGAASRADGGDERDSSLPDRPGSAQQRTGGEPGEAPYDVEEVPGSHPADAGAGGAHAASADAGADAEAASADAAGGAGREAAAPWPFGSTEPIGDDPVDPAPVDPAPVDPAPEPRTLRVPEPADSALAALDTGLVGPSTSFGAAAAAVSVAGARPGPYAGSALPAEDGSAPSPDHPVKANEGSGRYHTPDSPYYVRTRGDVWFRTAQDARAAGFTAWDDGRR